MRRKGRTNQHGRTLAPADARVELGGDNLELLSGFSELLIQAAELNSQGKWKEAIQICRMGLEIRPRDLSCLLLLGTTLWKNGEVKEAENTLTLARKEVENHARLYSTLAEIYQHKGDYEGAEKMLDLYRALSQVDLNQELSSPLENPSKADEEANSPIDPVLKHLFLLADAFKSRSFVGKSSNSFFTDDDRMIVKRILENG